MSSLDLFYEQGTDLSNVQIAEKLKPEIRVQWIANSLNCPYCLFRGRINDFTIWQEGKRSRSLRCPDCLNTITRKCLIKTSNYTIQQYADWLYWVKKYDHARKIKWDKLFQRSRDYGIASDLWYYYKIVKAKDIKYMEDNHIGPARDYSLADPDRPAE